MKWLRVAAVLAGSEADGVGCPEGEAFRGVCGESFSRVGGETGCWEAQGHEILDLTGWNREYRKLAREVERLKLAREASLVEQDLSNDLERRMCEEAASSKRKVEDGWAEVESNVEVMSNVSCSTCVEFNESPPPAPRYGLAESRRTEPTAERVRLP